MRFLLYFLVSFSLYAAPFKVATYNVQNLFDAKYVGTEYKDYQHSHNWTERMVEIKLNHTAEVICDLDADILALQEIENSTIFNQLQKRLKRVGCGYRYGAISTKNGAPIQVALLSRFPIQNQRELQVSYSPRVRNILEVEVEVEDTSLVLFVNHWKSRAYEGFESKRIRYAKVLKKRLDALSPNKPYIILGDFNTDYDAHLRLAKKIDDTKGRTGLHDIIHIAKEGGLTTESQMRHHSKGCHYTLWNELQIDERWNTKFFGKKGSADHIILPSSMFDQKGVDYINNSFGVFKKDYLFTKRGYIHSWQYKGGKHTGKGYSDHLPVYAYFDMAPYKPERDSSTKKVTSSVREIDYFYTIEALESDIRITDAVVVWKVRNNALIKQTKEGRGIFIYGSAGDLIEGRKYDLLVKAMKEYKGLKELTHVYVLKQKGKSDISQYILSEEDINKPITHRQNEVISNITGRYKDKHFYVRGRKIPIYFKNKNATPPNRTTLKIDNALIGYYKKLQLVVYHRSDFTILEK